MYEYENPLLALGQLGQSLWLDASGYGLRGGDDLPHLIAADGVAGVLCTPRTVAQALTEGDDHDACIGAFAADLPSPAAVRDRLLLDDAVRTADRLRSVFDESGGRDGYAGLALSPHLAHDSEGIAREARRLWQDAARPNVMIEIPATRESLPAVRRLLAEGINVNAALVFDVEGYQAVIESWFAALEARRSAGLPLDSVASVASVNVAAIDEAFDTALQAQTGAAAASLRGRVGRLSARLLYQHFLHQSGTPRWQALAAAGARPQRLLWQTAAASGPADAEIERAEALIGAGTVCALSPAALAAYRERGRPALRLQEQLDVTAALPAQLIGFGLQPRDIARRLEAQGLRDSIEAYARAERAVAGRLWQQRRMTPVP
jgi:transaldolase